MTLADIASAISRGEGAGASPTNRPTRNNNPGDLTGSGYPGQIGTDAGGFAIFSSPEAGKAALNQYLAAHLNQIGTGSGPYGNLNSNSTLQDFLNIYAGNPGPGYVGTVAQSLGVAPTTPLGKISGLLNAQGGAGTDVGVSNTLGPISGPYSAPVAAVAPDLTGSGSGSGVSGPVTGVSTGALLAVAGAVAAVAIYALG